MPAFKTGRVSPASAAAATAAAVAAAETERGLVTVIGKSSDDGTVDDCVVTPMAARLSSRLGRSCEVSISKTSLPYNSEPANATAKAGVSSIILPVAECKLLSVCVLSSLLSRTSVLCIEVCCGGGSLVFAIDEPPPTLLTFDTTCCDGTIVDVLGILAKGGASLLMLNRLLKAAIASLCFSLAAFEDVKGGLGCIDLRL
uniref:Uncharacterized protein n=1 Tax=Glossina palpalis gambiensis TaxID=67801 RepID=A0A1B0BAX8_9MUSC